MSWSGRAVLGWMAVVTAGAVAVNACSASGAGATGSGEGGAESSAGPAGPTTATSGATGAGGSNDFDGGATTGAGGFQPDAACASVSSEATANQQPADIVIAVDTSGSMDEESADVQANLNAFASIITGSGIDVHVILLADETVCIPAPLGSGSCPGDSNPPTYTHVLQTVASTDALSLVISTYPLWKEALRPGASKTIAVVSDDNSDLDAASFTSQLLALDPPTFQGFKFDAIVSFDSPDVCLGCFFNCAACASKCCDHAFLCEPISAAEGTVYKQLVASTGGVIGNLCEQDFAPVFTDMATAVVAGSTISCIYDLPEVPGGGTIDPAKVNVSYTAPGGAPQTLGYVPGGAAACGPQSGGWYYDNPAQPTQILLCDATCTAIQGNEGAKVEVLFGCDTIVADPR